MRSNKIFQAFQILVFLVLTAALFFPLGFWTARNGANNAPPSLISAPLAASEKNGGEDVINLLKKEIGEKQESINALEEILIKLTEERDQAIKEKEEQENTAEAAEEKIIYQDDLIRALREELSEAKSRNKALAALFEQSIKARAEALGIRKEN